jgi:hypothetical protein
MIFDFVFFTKISFCKKMDEQAFFDFIDQEMTNETDDRQILQYNDGCEYITLSCITEDTYEDVYSFSIMYHESDDIYYVKVYIKNDEISHSVWSSKYDDDVKNFSRDRTMEELKGFFPLEELFEAKEPSED